MEPRKSSSPLRTADRYSQKALSRAQCPREWVHETQHSLDITAVYSSESLSAAALYLAISLDDHASWTVVRVGHSRLQGRNHQTMTIYPRRTPMLACGLKITFRFAFVVHCCRLLALSKIPPGNLIEPGSELLPGVLKFFSRP